MGECCTGKHYLLYNPHTFPGKMKAWCPNKKVSFNVSKSEIEDCSLESRYWMQGFLSGNEPDAPKNKTGDYLPKNHPKSKQWLATIKQFPETGIWICQERVCETCGEELLPTQPGLRCPNCSLKS